MEEEEEEAGKENDVVPPRLASGMPSTRVLPCAGRGIKDEVKGHHKERGVPEEVVVVVVGDLGLVFSIGGRPSREGRPPPPLASTGELPSEMGVAHEGVKRVVRKRDRSSTTSSTVIGCEEETAREAERGDGRLEGGEDTEGSAAKPKGEERCGREGSGRGVGRMAHSPPRRRRRPPPPPPPLPPPPRPDGVSTPKEDPDVGGSKVLAASCSLPPIPPL